MIFKIGEGYLQKSVILALFYLRKNAKCDENTMVWGIGHVMCDLLIDQKVNLSPSTALTLRHKRFLNPPPINSYLLRGAVAEIVLL